MNIKVFQYNFISDTDQCLLADLLRCVWKDIDIKEIHSQEMNTTSFCAVTDNIFVGYTGVIKWSICINGIFF